MIKRQMKTKWSSEVRNRPLVISSHSTKIVSQLVIHKDKDKEFRDEVRVWPIIVDMVHETIVTGYATSSQATIRIFVLLISFYSI